MRRAGLETCSDPKGLATVDVELKGFETSLCFSSDVKEEAPLASATMKAGSMGQSE